MGHGADVAGDRAGDHLDAIVRLALPLVQPCPLYPSDAADEEECVSRGWLSVIKKKK